MQYKFNYYYLRRNKELGVLLLTFERGPHDRVDSSNIWEWKDKGRDSRQRLSLRLTPLFDGVTYGKITGAWRAS